MSDNVQNDVFDVLLDDIRCSRVSKASFVGLIKTEEQVGKLVQALHACRQMKEIDASMCELNEKGVILLC